MRKIIDVSYAQQNIPAGLFVSWGMVAELAGIDGYYGKACDGCYEDNAWIINYRRSQEVGVPCVGGYQWYYPPRPDQNGQQQAVCLLRTIGKDVMPIEDTEIDGMINGRKVTYPADLATYNDYCACLSTLDDAKGYAVPYYSGYPTMFKFLVKRDAKTGKQLFETDPLTKKQYPLWPDWLTCRPLLFSAYPNRKALPKNVKFDQWNLDHRTYGIPDMLRTLTDVMHYPTDKLWLWQFEEKGIIPGIPGTSVDLNYEVGALHV